MNKFFQTLTVLLLVSSLTYAGNKSEMLQSFLKEVTELQADQVNGSEPLIQVAALLSEKAAQKITLTKTNMNDALEDAGNFKHAIIVVGKHTLVKITDLNDRISSGSWAASMPKGVALIQKQGELNERTDYLNMLIGIPDDQERTLYLLN